MTSSITAVCERELGALRIVGRGADLTWRFDLSATFGREPAEDAILERLDDCPVPDKAARQRVPERVHATLRPKGVPEWDAGLVGDSVAVAALSGRSLGE